MCRRDSRRHRGSGKALLRRQGRVSHQPRLAPPLTSDCPNLYLDHPHARSGKPQPRWAGTGWEEQSAVVLPRRIHLALGAGKGRGGEYYWILRQTVLMWATPY